MANNKIKGEEIFLRVMDGAQEAYIVCEQTSELSITNEGVEVRCKNTGEWAEYLDGGNKAGTISFSAAYVNDPLVNNLSFETMFSYIGLVKDWIWGGIDSGDFIIETKAILNSLTITANQNEVVTFTMELQLSEAPTLTQVPT